MADSLNGRRMRRPYRLRLTQSVGKYIRRGGACAARVAEILLDNGGFVKRATHASPLQVATDAIRGEIHS